ncbi:MAG: helix-turn-helix domain-containing protein [Calothrix sp. SM1_5_4]|nr:helix-turn-helix domain-containing protein [Calothrix sp. SM1_5_4]
MKEQGNHGNIDFRNQSLFKNRVEREWLETKEAAHFLSITPNALRIMAHRDRVRVFKFGRRLRFRLADLRTLFERKGA